MDMNDPSYEPIIGGHKSYSWEKELRERGLHASANEIARDGDAYFEGPQGHPAPGSGSPRRDRLSASPDRRLRQGESPVIGSYGSPVGVGMGSPSGASYASPTKPSYQDSRAYSTTPPAYPGTTSSPRTINMPPAGYGMGGPAPIATATAHAGVAPPVYHTTTTTTTYAAPPAANYPPAASYPPATYSSPTAAYAQPPAYAQPAILSTGVSPPRAYSPSNTFTSSPRLATSGVHGGSPYSGAAPIIGSGSPMAASTPLHQVGTGIDNDPSYEPIIGGHKSHSWEKELRERGMHASANRVAADGDMFFEGPQGHPAPGSGSPRRDRVSPSPSRRGPSPV